MKRILICASRVSHILNFHIPYIKYFKEKGYEVHIAVQGNTDNPLIDRCFDLCFTKNFFSPKNIGTVFKLKKIIQDGNYSAVYTNTTLAGTAVRAALMLVSGGRPYCVHISHGYMFSQKNSIKQKLILACEKMTKSPTDCLVVMNEEDYALADKYRLGKKLYYINGMGLTGERFPQISVSERRAVRQRLNADDDTKILLCVGEFSSRKNQVSLIEAFNRLRAAHKNIMLVFAGVGADFEKCKMLAEKYELTGCIKFLGQVKDVNLLYRSSDLLVSASKMEGMPFNVMEALYCGLPAAVSNIKGHRELIEEGVNGFLFDGNDVGDICSKIDGILSDGEVYEKLKTCARLDEKYLVENVRPTLLKILDRNFDSAEQPKNKEIVHL